MKKIVVTRHVSLVEWLKKNDYIDDAVEHISHANPDGNEIAGKHVYGILPNWLACKAAKITEVQLRLPPEVRGKELSLKDIEFYAVKPRTYIIKEVKENE